MSYELMMASICFSIVGVAMYIVVKLIKHIDRFGE